MLVAWITNHMKNGFFIFRPGEGYEYVMTLTICGLALSCLGGGRWSIDHAIGIFDPPGWLAAGLCMAAGVVGAAGLLITFWRPAPKKVAVTLPDTRSELTAVGRRLGEAGTARGVLAHDLAASGVRQRRHLGLHRLERVRVQAGRMGEVGLEEDVVLADGLDQIRQLVRGSRTRTWRRSCA